MTKLCNSGHTTKVLLIKSFNVSCIGWCSELELQQYRLPQNQNVVVLKQVPKTMDYGHPERAFFQKFETFGLGQTNWAEIYEAFWVFLAKL